MKLGKVILWIVILVLIAWGLTALNKPVDETGPIKIGFVGPLSGDAVSYGEPALAITKIAVDKINAEGGIDGRQIELVIEDGKCDGTSSVSATQKLINIDKVKVLTGYICSGEAIPSVALVQNGQAFILSSTASSPDLTGISKYFARLYPSDAGQGKVIADKANANEVKKVAILHESTDYALGVVEAFKKEFKGEIVAEAFQSDATDLRTPLSKLQTSGADGLFLIVQTPASGEKLLNQLSKTTWKPELMLDNVLATSKDLTKKYASLVEGAYSSNLYINEDDAELKYLREEYAKKNNGAAIPFESYMVMVYDSPFLVKDAIEANGENPEKLSKWFLSLNNWDKGASGPVSIDANGDRTSGNTLIVIKNGSYEFVK